MTMSTKDSSKKVVSENRESSIKFYVMLIGLTIMVVAAAVILGKSDQGEIDVNAAIISANETRKESGDETTEEVNTIPKRLRDLPNGGLVPTDTVVEEVPQPSPEPEVESASTTGDSSQEDETTDEETAEDELVPTEETQGAPIEEAQAIEETQE